MSKNTSTMRGFTLVELLIVIVVIAILAGIVLVTYTNIQGRAHDSSLQSDLKQAAKSIEISSARSLGSYPTTMPSSINVSPGNVLQLANTGDAKTFCINGYGPNNLLRSYNSAGGLLHNFLCSGATEGSAIGGTVPTAPTNTNLVSGFSNWTLNGGVSYDSTNDQIVFNSATSGNAISPLIRIDGSNNAVLTLDGYATKSSPSETPKSGFYESSAYYTADGSTPVKSTAGYTGNGHASPLPLSSWTTATWTTPTGPNVIYVRFVLNNSPTNYTSDNIYRNPSIQASN